MHRLYLLIPVISGYNYSYNLKASPRHIISAARRAFLRPRIRVEMNLREVCWRSVNRFELKEAPTGSNQSQSSILYHVTHLTNQKALLGHTP